MYYKVEGNNSFIDDWYYWCGPMQGFQETALSLTMELLEFQVNWYHFCVTCGGVTCGGVTDVN